MPAAFDACQKGGGRIRTKKTKDGFIHVCFPKGGGPGIAGHPHMKEEACNFSHEDIITEDFSPKRIRWSESFKVTEAKDSKGGVMIEGIAARATTSRNGITYTVEELARAKDSLISKTIGLNHSENVLDNVAAIEEADFDGQSIPFRARVVNTPYHPKIEEFIRTGLVKHVSLEALIPKFRIEGDKKIASGLEFTGLSFIRTPGIVGADFQVSESFEQALAEAEEDTLVNTNKGEILTLELPAGSENTTVAGNIKGERMDNTENKIEKQVVEVKMPEQFFEKFALMDTFAKKVEAQDKKIEELEAKLAEKTKGIVTEDVDQKGRQGENFVSTGEGKGKNARSIAFYKNPSYISMAYEINPFLKASAEE